MSLRHIFIALTLLLCANPLLAHPLPISALDLDYGPTHLDGRLTVHMRDLAPQLRIVAQNGRFEADEFTGRAPEIAAILADGLSIDGRAMRVTSVAAAEGDAEALRIGLDLPGPQPPELVIRANLFPAAADHQTFVNLYEGGALRQQWLLGAGSAPVTYFAGTAAGLLSVARAFVASGVHHILIGPDHVLFLVGLLLLGGPIRRLVLIVTAFTLGHSVTLSLAATNTFVIPASIIEPAIALSIVVVGLDNLLRGTGPGQGRDIRPWLALGFGLVHGFGFAYVLREFGLPQANLAVALASFNLGVELGQIAIVLIVATMLALVRRRSETAANRIAMAGSLAVVAAGIYWFVDRVFFGG